MSISYKTCELCCVLFTFLTQSSEAFENLCHEHHNTAVLLGQDSVLILKKQEQQ